MKWFIYNDDKGEWLKEGDKFDPSFLAAEEFDSEDAAYKKADELHKALDTTEIYVFSFNYCR